MTSVGNMDVEKQLDELPDKVAAALQLWRLATLEREKVEALLYIKAKFEFPDMSAMEVKAKINSDADRFDVVSKEIMAESNYKRLEETLMAAKKRASLRTAY